MDKTKDSFLFKLMAMSGLQKWGCISGEGTK